MSIISHWKALSVDGLELILDDLHLIHDKAECYSPAIPISCTITYNSNVKKSRLGGGKILYTQSYYIDVKGIGAGNYIFSIDYTTLNMYFYD